MSSSLILNFSKNYVYLIFKALINFQIISRFFAAIGIICGDFTLNLYFIKNYIISLLRSGFLFNKKFIKILFLKESFMTKTFSKTFLFLLILFAISCSGNDITGGGGGIISQPPDNRVPTETEISKDFLQNTFSKYSKGKVLEYGGKSYTFGSDAERRCFGKRRTI